MLVRFRLDSQPDFENGRGNVLYVVGDDEVSTDQGRHRAWATRCQISSPRGLRPSVTRRCDRVAWASETRYSRTARPTVTLATCS